MSKQQMQQIKEQKQEQEIEIANRRTLIKPSPVVQISGHMSVLQHKIYNTLLLNAREALKKNYTTTFLMKLTDIKRLLGIEYETNKYIKEQLKELMKITVEYNILKKDQTQEWGAFVILPAVLIQFSENEKVNLVKYQLPFQVVQALRGNELYAKLKIGIIRQLQSKYSLILYELLEDYKGAQLPEMDIATFRELFGVVNKYKRFQDLRENVIDVAVSELNRNENIEYYVHYKLKKKGRKYTHIKFYTQKRPEKLSPSEKFNRALDRLKNQNRALYEQITMCMFVMWHDVDKKYEVDVSKKYTKVLFDILCELLEEYGKDIVLNAIKRIRQNNLEYLKMSSTQFALELKKVCKKLLKRGRFIGGKNEAKTTTQKTE